jgi:hypothetical protein
MKMRLLRWPALRSTASADVEAVRAQERAAREARRSQAADRRRQVAGELARSALAWSLNAWLEGSMWLCMVLGLAVDYIGSYADLEATFTAFGYDSRVSWIMPLGVDLPATASVLGQLLAGRWRCGWWVRVRLGLLTLCTAPLTLVGNALRGAIDPGGHFAFHVELWMDLLAFAVPGLGVVVIGYVASMMQAERAELQRRRLEAEAVRPATAVGQDAVPDATEPSPPVPTPRQSQPPAGRRTARRRSGRVPASEVLAMVRGARERLVGELEREPSDHDVAAVITAGGHPISASRTRMYLAQLRAAEQPRDPASAAEEGEA